MNDMCDGNEEWKDIKGYEGYYQVSNLGRVKSLERLVKHSKGGFKKINEIILKPLINNGGYYCVKLCKYGKYKTKKIHQLVGIAFLNHKPNGHILIVDHINSSDKSNNKLSNLQIISQRENASKDRKNKTSKYTGVDWNKQQGKWHSRIRINGKTKHLGYFLNEMDAHIAYQSALKGAEVIAK